MKTSLLTNVTLKVETEVLREARVVAARRGLSVSRMMANELEELVRREAGYETAKRRALARLRQGLDLGWTPPRSREELHER